MKARVAERLDLPGLFDEQSSLQKFTGINELRRLVKTHNLALLFVVGGLQTAFEQKCTADPEFYTASNWLNEWNEGLRYRSPGTVTEAGIQHFFSTLEGPTGLLQWIAQH